MPEGKLSHYSSKTWRCRIEDRVNGATRWYIVQGKKPVISVPEFRPLASKNRRREVSSETVAC